MLTLGPPILFRPVCILYPHGFIGGPKWYERTDDTNARPLIVERVTDGEGRMKVTELREAGTQ